MDEPPKKKRKIAEKYLSDEEDAESKKKSANDDVEMANAESSEQPTQTDQQKVENSKEDNAPKEVEENSKEDNAPKEVEEPVKDSWFESAQIGEDGESLVPKAQLEDETPPSVFFRSLKPTTGSDACPYLDQINRQILDFDNRKLCSVTMTSLNVYGCLVCGVYFGGRTRGTPAYEHALETGHKMFIHLKDSRIFCLPEDYEIEDNTLNDIKHNLHPTFTKQEVGTIDTRVKYAHALNGLDYLPGVLGLNDLTLTSWCNSTIQILLKVKPLRNFFLNKKNYEGSNSDLVNVYGELVRKYHNPRNFKTHISPHELLQAVLDRSQKKFQVGVNSDPLEFMGWFLHALHEDLGGTRKKSTVVSKVFQGQVLIERSEIPGKSFNEVEYKKTPFLYLLLDLPPMPLFKDGAQDKFIPQVSLTELLSKFDGKQLEVLKDGSKRRMRITKLPKYLILAYRRFKDGYFSIEKNTTIVNTVIRGLDLKIYLQKPEEHKQSLQNLPIEKLQETMKKMGGKPSRNREEIIDFIANKKRQKYRKYNAKYDLIGNLTHSGNYKEGTNKAFVLNSANNQWYDMEDVHNQETIPQLVSVAESYLQVWQSRNV